jgi:hypothetical protein
MTIFAVIVLLVVLVLGDRVANAVAENSIANKIQSTGFPVKPSVTIEGFPFLTQVIAHDVGRVDISANNVPAEGVTITSVKAVAAGVHLNSSFNGATIDHINGTVFVSFAALASAGSNGTGVGLSLSADGPDKVKIKAGLGPVSDTEVAQVSKTGPSEISVRVLNSGGSLGGALSSFGSYSFTVPKLPAGLQVQNVSVTSGGLRISAAATHSTLGQ